MHICYNHHDTTDHRIQIYITRKCPTRYEPFCPPLEAMHHLRTIIPQFTTVSSNVYHYAHASFLETFYCVIKFVEIT